MADNYLLIQYGNTCDLGNIYYSGGYQNKLYLQTEIGQPEYVHEKETKENGDGVIIPINQKLVKKYKFVVTGVNEPVVDALMALQMHDTINIYYTNGLYSGSARNFTAVPTWDFDGCTATVECSFEQDDHILSTACCVELDVTEVIDSDCDPCHTVVDFGSTDPASIAGSVGAMQVGKKYIMREYDGSNFTYTGQIGTFVETTGGANVYTYDTSCTYVEMDGTILGNAGDLYVYCSSKWWQANDIQSQIVVGTSITFVAYGIAGAYSIFYVSTDGGFTYTNYDVTEYVSDSCPDTPFEGGEYDFSAIASGTTLYFKIETYTDDCYTGFSQPYSYIVP